MKLSRPTATPCRVGHAKAATGTPRIHTCSQEHRALVEAYREAREVYEYELEDRAIGYRTEADMIREELPPVTFKAYLTRRAR